MSQHKYYFFNCSFTAVLRRHETFGFKTRRPALNALASNKNSRNLHSLRWLYLGR